MYANAAINRPIITAAILIIFLMAYPANMADKETATDRTSKGHQISDCGHLLSFPWIYCATALRMNVLLGISPRDLSVCLTNDIGNVIPTLSVIIIAGCTSHTGIIYCTHIAIRISLRARRIRLELYVSIIALCDTARPPYP